MRHQAVTMTPRSRRHGGDVLAAMAAAGRVLGATPPASQQARHPGEGRYPDAGDALVLRGLAWCGNCEMPMKASRMAAGVCTYACGRGRQAVDALALDRVVSDHAEQQAPSVVQSLPEPGRANVLATPITRVVVTADGEPEIAWLVQMASHQPRRVLQPHDSVRPPLDYLRFGDAW